MRTANDDDDDDDDDGCGGGGKYKLWRRVDGAGARSLGTESLSDRAAAWDDEA